MIAVSLLVAVFVGYRGATASNQYSFLITLLYLRHAFDVFVVMFINSNRHILYIMYYVSRRHIFNFPCFCVIKKKLKYVLI